jgi:hypothetical protein
MRAFRCGAALNMTNHFDKMTSWKRARATSEQSGVLAEGRESVFAGAKTSEAPRQRREEAMWLQMMKKKLAESW